MDFLRSFNPITLYFLEQKTFIEDFLFSIYILITIYLLSLFFLSVIEKINPAENTSELYKRRKMGRIVLFLFALLLIIPGFFSRIEYLPTILGFTGAGLVISLKEFIQNIAAWFLVMGPNGFSVGDRVEVNGVKGDVVNTGLMRFTLLEVDQANNADQSTNRIIHIPNYIILTANVFIVSHKMDFVWDEVLLFLSVDSDWKRAETICDEVLKSESVIDPEFMEKKARELSKNYLVRVGKTTPIVYTELQEGKIILSLRYMTPIRERRNHRSSISKEIMRRFAGEDSIKLYIP